VLALGRLSRTQVELLYMAPQRGEHGEILLPPVTIGTPMTGRKLFEYRLSLIGIRDPETVAALWAEEKLKQPDKKTGR
jgi:hypothetical protein